VAAAKRPRRERVAPVVITASAAQRIKHLLSERSPPAKGVRLGVRTRGCNGLSYTMKYVDEVSPKDEVVTQHDVTVFVDPKALFYVVGTTMDFVEDDLRSEFVFVNPNQKGSCGCGESFNV
jgi:iron-sulfur cluster assembly protein